MKTLNDYMAMSYRMEIVEDKDEGGFVVSYPGFAWLYYLWRDCGKCGEKTHWMQKAWLENWKKVDFLEDYSGQFKLRIPRSLHPITGRTFSERGNQ